MKILYYDCFSRISGDMNLAAMIALGIAPAYLEKELEKLGLKAEYTITYEQDSRKGIAGTKVNVTLATSSNTPEVTFEPPSWFGTEVTDDPRWGNANLARYGRPDGL